ncbi:MAG: AAA family ATPase [Labrys sp. (in: a-proteobacteria)]
MDSSIFDNSLMTMLEAALDLAARGAFVFPCVEARTTPPDEPDDRKRPKPGIFWGRASTRDPAAIERYWTRWPDALIGLDLGKMGIFVADADRKPGRPDGVQEWMDLCAEHGYSDTDVPRVSTASMGEHLYFRQPEGEPIKNKKVGVAIDGRGAGGYVIAPGSTFTDDGRDYRLMWGDILNPAPMPQWLVDRLRASSAPPVPQTPANVAVMPPRDTSTRDAAYATRAIEDEINKLAAMPKDSGRNIALNTAAFNLGQLVAGGILPESEVQSALVAACQQNGLVRDDGMRRVLATIRSGLTAGARSPRKPPEQEAAPLVFVPRQVRQEGESLIDAETGEVIEEKPRGVIRDLGEDVEYVHPEELVRDTIPATGVGFLAGQSGAYKTFLAVELSFCLMTGADFAGRLVERTGPVLFAAFEGSGTIAGRVKARRTRCPDPSKRLPFYTLENFGAVSSSQDFQDFILDIRKANARAIREHGSPLVAVIIDTVAASGMIGEDKENDPAAWQRIFANLNPLSAEIGAPIILIHHYGKNAEAGLRGSSNARAGADFVLAMTCLRNEITGETENHFLALTKSRTAREGSICAVEAERVQIGYRRDGSPVSSLVLNFDTSLRLTSAKNLEPNKGGRPSNHGHATLLDAFHAALADHGADVRVHGEAEATMVRAVKLPYVRAEFCKRYATGEDGEEQQCHATRMAFKRSLKRASDEIITGTWDASEWAWSTKKS